MEKSTENSTLILQETRGSGTVKIADDVVALIAALAATEVKGVSSLAGNLTNELMSRVGIKNLTKGVKVNVLEGNVTVDLTLNMEFGYHIPETCHTVQEKVKTAVENMTGLTCSDVNIRIAGINLNKE